MNTGRPRVAPMAFFCAFGLFYLWVRLMLIRHMYISCDELEHLHAAW